MKTFKILSIFAIFLAFTSCDSDDPIILLPVETDSVVNLEAPQSGGQGQPTSGDFTKFSFATGTTTTGDNWDIAFRGTTILVNGGESTGTADEPSRTGNGGAYIASGTMASISQVDTTLLVQDTSTDLAITGWYDYNPTNHVITAVAGKIIIVKTHDGKYAKIEILSYYKDGDTSGESRYYTFDYVYNPNIGETIF